MPVVTEFHQPRYHFHIRYCYTAPCIHSALFCRLQSSLGIWTPVIVALIAYLFLGLDALSAELEEPFGIQENDLALDSMVRNIEREMLSSLGGDLPPVIVAHKGNLI